MFETHVNTCCKNEPLHVAVIISGSVFVKSQTILVSSVLFVSYVLPLKGRGEAGSWNIVVLISAETQWSRGHWLGQLSAHCRFVPQFNSYSALTIPALFSGTRTIIRRVRIQSAACCWCWYQVWDLCRVTSRCNLYWLPRAEECSPAQPSADLEQGCS